MCYQTGTTEVMNNERWELIVVKWSSSFLFGVGPLVHTLCTRGDFGLGWPYVYVCILCEYVSIYVVCVSESERGICGKFVGRRVFWESVLERSIWRKCIGRRIFQEDDICHQHQVLTTISIFCLMLIDSSQKGMSLPCFQPNQSTLWFTIFLGNT